jgi:hypothetical protein
MPKIKITVNRVPVESENYETEIATSSVSFELVTIPDNSVIPSNLQVNLVTSDLNSSWGNSTPVNNRLTFTSSTNRANRDDPYTLTIVTPQSGSDPWVICNPYGLIDQIPPKGSC